MYLKAVSTLRKEEGSNPQIWVSPKFESIKYETKFVTNFEEYDQFINHNDNFTKSNYYVYIDENFALDTEKALTDAKEDNEWFHPYFRDNNHIGIGLFKLDELSNTDKARTYIFAGVEIYLLNDDGDTLESIDLS